MLQQFLFISAIAFSLFSGALIAESTCSTSDYSSQDAKGCTSMYTCCEHHEVMQSTMGKCPKCGKALIPCTPKTK